MDMAMFRTLSNIIRWYRGKRSKYFKQQSNRKIRRYKGELHKGNMAHKLYDFWWELC